MPVIAVFINYSNHSQPVSSGLAAVLNPGVSLKEVEIIIKNVAQNTSVQVGTTFEQTMKEIINALDGKASINELKIITVDTELFG